MALCFDCSKLIKGPGKKNECMHFFLLITMSLYSTHPFTIYAKTSSTGPICKTKIKDIIKTYTT